MLYGRLPNGQRPMGTYQVNDIRFDDQGNFRLILSRNEPSNPDDWLKLNRDVHMVMVRQYFYDRAKSQKASLKFALKRGGL